MKYDATVKYILSEFRIGKNYVGYDYIIDGIHIMEIDKSSISHITKTLYIDIANKYHTTSICVERSIRATIEIMWRNKACNLALLSRIFGKEYLSRRPTNTQFFELLYDYVESGVYEYRNVNCPFLGCGYCMMRYIDHTEPKKEK